MYNNQFLVKRFYKTDGTIVLVSENEEYSPIVIDSKENVNIVGKVVEIRRVPKRKGTKKGR
jgi:SOS-response transcriptional repressor LexA